jgi:hypothetical protein
VTTGSAARGRRDLQTSTAGRCEYVLCAVGVGEGGAASIEAALAGRRGEIFAGCSFVKQRSKHVAMRPAGPVRPPEPQI